MARREELTFDQDSALLRRGDVASKFSRARRLAATYPLGAFGLAMLVGMIAAAALAPLLATHDPLAISGLERLQGPSASHWMGTDNLGRDLYSRVIYAAQPAVIIGFGALAIGVSIGLVVGAVSGYVGGIFDLLTQRVIDALMALPGLVVAIAVIAVVGGGQSRVMLAIGISLSPLVARVVRGSTLSVKQNTYMEAALAVGASRPRILARHVLPNIMAPLIVIASVELSAAILAEASLSFLGFGVPPPQPSWGSLLSGEGRQFMRQAPWLILFPSVAISLAVLGINLLGDSVRDVFDPRLRGK